MTMLTFVTKFFIYSLTTTTTTIRTTITTTLINISRNSSGRNRSGSTTPATTGEGTRGALRLESQVRFLAFFCTILMFVLPRSTRN